jgi:hypothetical protein
MSDMPLSKGARFVCVPVLFARRDGVGGFLSLPLRIISLMADVVAPY